MVTNAIQIKETKTKKILLIALFITGICFGQNEIIHISKTHQDGTPKEVILYKRLNNDLQSNNPFEVVNKISYDSKGNWLRPKLTGAAKKAGLMIIGRWVIASGPGETEISFEKDGIFNLYLHGELDEDEGGNWFLTQRGDDIFINVKESRGNNKEYEKMKIVFINNNQFLTLEKGEPTTFNRKK